LKAIWHSCRLFLCSVSIHAFSSLQRRKWLVTATRSIDVVLVAFQHLRLVWPLLPPCSPLQKWALSSSFFIPSATFPPFLQIAVSRTYSGGLFLRRLWKSRFGRWARCSSPSHEEGIFCLDFFQLLLQSLIYELGFSQGDLNRVGLSSMELQAVRWVSCSWDIIRLLLGGVQIIRVISVLRVLRQIGRTGKTRYTIFRVAIVPFYQKPTNSTIFFVW
jgi:hypothetical protein